MRALNVALLRAINVGGNRKVPMAELRALFARLGATDVRTYIQSGNVVYGGDLAAETLHDALRTTFGFEIPVVTRTGAELAALRNPWPDEDPAIVAVMFLTRPPTKPLDPNRSPPDELVVQGRDVWMRCPTTFAKTKLTVDWFERHGVGTATARNLRTVQTLTAWTGDAAVG